MADDGRVTGLVAAGGVAPALAPLTRGLPAAVLEVLDRPLLDHAVELLRRHGLDEVTVALGPLGPALAAAPPGDVVVLAGEVLSGADVSALLAAHRAAGAVATLGLVRPGAGMLRDAVVLDAADGRVVGVQRDVDGDEALSDLAVSGLLVVGPAGRELLAGDPEALVTAADLPEALLAHDAACAGHVSAGAWAPVRTPQELLAATWAALDGAFGPSAPGEAIADGVLVGPRVAFDGIELLEPPLWLGRDVRVGARTRLLGPVAVGAGARIGAGCTLRGCVVLPGAVVPNGIVLLGGTFA
ncbi:MAG: mannose-phosphate guanylyltransferase [Solirubrobacteraceae bacterium]|jgi:NDP-sugar pyrophosphorylase family protein|nr:mannose-phosphate guanylyltransferase [Solirubrobacteraceae bacterium]